MRAQARVGANADWFVPAGLVLTLCVVVAQVTTQLIDFGVYDLRIAALDSNKHTSVFGLASLVAQGAVAAAAALRAGTPPHRRAWTVLALLVAALLVVRIVFPFSTAPLLPFVAVVFIVLWRLAIDEPRAPARAIRLGLGLLVFSFVVHVVGPHLMSALGYAGDTWEYQVKGILKHGGELAGWMTIATGIAAAALARLRRA